MEIYIRTIKTPEITTPSPYTYIGEWRHTTPIRTAYFTNMVVTYNNIYYKVIMAHLSTSTPPPLDTTHFEATTVDILNPTITPAVYREDKLSLFGDEEIELTRAWNDQQVISGYGSYSKQFSVPINFNNSEIFKYYDVLGAQSVDPNYFMKCRIIINEYELVGNIQLLGFSMKDGQRYSYQLAFFGQEKNLINYLNASAYPKLNDLDISKFKFNFSKNDVVNSWYQQLDCFVPIMATNRPLNYRDYVETGNINFSVMGNTSGVSMRDLSVSYNFKSLLESMLVQNNLQLSASTNVTKFLYNLYLMPNTNVEYTSNLTYIYTESRNVSPYRQVLTPNSTTTTGIMPGNQDLISWDNITDYTISDNTYSAQTSGEYIFKFSAKQLKELVTTDNINSYNIYVIDNVSLNILASTSYGTTDGNADLKVTLNAGQKVHIYVDYTYTYYDYDPYMGYMVVTTTGPYPEDRQVGLLIKISKNNDTANYNYEKTDINFPDTYVSQFLIDFCKSFNIFFIFEDNYVKLYFKNELPVSNYDLSDYLLVDGSYNFTNDQKYKNINYQFAEGKDINNIAYKKSNTAGLQFGQNKKTYNYDCGQDKLEFKSIFTVFPRTTLNRTDKDNSVLEDTRIPLHSELNESLSKLNTDYLLFYRYEPVSGLTRTYGLQYNITGYTEMNFASDYGPTNTYGYSLDYNVLPYIIKDNTTKKYSVTMNFVLPSNILYNLKVYDIVVIKNVWYEIVEIVSNLNTGVSSISLLTL